MAGAPRLGPRPVDPGVDLVDEAANLHLFRVGAIEVRLTEERARQENRRVDGGQLAVLEALPGLHVEEVIEEPL
jgi:hypothetical protein